MAEGNGNAGVSATAEPPASETARVEEVVVRSLAQTRSWLNRRRMSPQVLGPNPRLCTREWLVRASFALFAVVTMGVVVFSALSLLNANEAIAAMLPVSTLAAVIVGVYLGDRGSS